MSWARKTVSGESQKMFMLFTVVVYVHITPHECNVHHTNVVELWLHFGIWFLKTCVLSSNSEKIRKQGENIHSSWGWVTVCSSLVLLWFILWSFSCYAWAKLMYSSWHLLYVTGGISTKGIAHGFKKQADDSMTMTLLEFWFICTCLYIYTSNIIMYSNCTNLARYTLVQSPWPNHSSQNIYTCPMASGMEQVCNMDV